MTDELMTPTAISKALNQLEQGGEILGWKEHPLFDEWFVIHLDGSKSHMDREGATTFCIMME